MNPVAIKYLKQFLKWIAASFNVSDQGSSAKKLTAFAFMVLVVYLHVRYVDHDNAIEFLIVDSSAVMTALGVATFDKIQSRKTKNGGGDEQSV